IRSAGTNCGILTGRFPARGWLSRTSTKCFLLVAPRRPIWHGGRLSACQGTAAHRDCGDLYGTDAVSVHFLAHTFDCERPGYQAASTPWREGWVDGGESGFDLSRFLGCCT